jgi:hypothetical protein
MQYKQYNTLLNNSRSIAILDINEKLEKKQIDNKNNNNHHQSNASYEIIDPYCMLELLNVRNASDMRMRSRL